MGLLTVIKKAKQKEKELRLLVVGLDNAGKTTIVRRLNGQDITTVTPTLGFTITTLLHQGFKLNIWDVGGQKSLRPYWRNYFEKTDGLIWVVDSADTVRLKDTGAELAELLKEERLMGAPLLILANKQDIPGALSVEQLHETLQLELITKRHCSVLACSAVSGLGVLEGFQWMVQQAASTSLVPTL